MSVDSVYDALSRYENTNDDEKMQRENKNNYLEYEFGSIVSEDGNNVTKFVKAELSQCINYRIIKNRRKQFTK